MPDDTPDPLTDGLYDLLTTHRGRDNAITSGEIADELGITDGTANPTTRFAIRDLIQSTGLPIAGSPNGYFVIDSRQELRDYITRLEQRKAGIDARIHHVRNAYQTDTTQTTLDAQPTDKIQTDD